MHDNIINLNDDIFETRIVEQDSRHLLFLVDFWAEWCSPCKIIAPFLEDIAVEFNDSLIVAKINIDENPVVTKKYGVRGIPTLLLFKDGEILEKKVGILSKQQLKEFISSYL